MNTVAMMEEATDLGYRLRRETDGAVNQRYSTVLPHITIKGSFTLEAGLTGPFVPEAHMDLRGK